MSKPLGQEIEDEAELIERFVRSYRRKFAAAIEQLNRLPEPAAELRTELQCLRLCVEAVDMVLVNQDRLVRALRKLSADQPALQAA
ncbi:MAG: hypothetical protein JWN24_407 [Phycisphaerales bacterium]|jgi:hypothetical protein|nr:hypothetical protein [Phycisphaerales bacterium]